MKVTPGSPDIVVGELDTIFDSTDDTVYTSQDAETVRQGGKVEITFTVGQQQEHQLGAEAVEALQRVSGSNLSLFLECSLEKEVYDSVAQTVEAAAIPQSSVLLEIRLPLPPELQGRYGYTVSRIHEGEAQAIPQGESNKNADGEYFTVSEDKTFLILRAQNFSAYAVGYTERPSGRLTTTYPPVQEESENGSYTLSPSRPAAGQTVTITPKPAEGYETERVIVTDRNGKEVEVTPTSSGTYTFTQPGSTVTVTVVFRPAEAPGCPRDESCPISAFTDADSSAWYHDGVHYCVENGLMTGTSKTTFAPNRATTRGMIVTILWRLAGSPIAGSPTEYTDVNPEDWYGQAIGWADGAGVVTGYGGGRFGPDDSITREQMAAMLWRYAGCPEAEGDLAAFADGAQTSSWAQPAMIWAVNQGLMTGVGGDRLAPRGQATRAQAATILMRFVSHTALQ